MARRDPLLSALKVCILDLKAEECAVTDASPQLSSCCQLLELILRKGLLQPVLGQQDYWHCVEQLPQQDTCTSLSFISLALEKTSTCKKLLTAQGKGRYFIRLALQRKIMAKMVQHLMHTPRILECYSDTVSILRNEEFLEPFLSLLLVLSELEFSLDLQNCSFLDESWILPVCTVYEAVPCRELGMVLRYLGGRVFVLDLIGGSQAQVSGCVQPGDIIDEINGISLRNAKNGQAGVLLTQLKGHPLALRMLHWRGANGAIYPPVVKHLRELQRENPSLQTCTRAGRPEERQHGPSQCLEEGRIVYIVEYLGQADIGLFGGKEVLQHAIPVVLEQNQPSKTVFFDLKETHLTCSENHTRQELFAYHYPEISCVGRLSEGDGSIFAFCVA